MSDPRTPDRLLAAWFEADAPASAPDALKTDIYRATSRIRPVPPWLARMRGNPMDVILGGAGRRNTRLVPIFALLLLTLAIAAGAVFVGTRPNPRPVVVAPPASPTAGPTQAGSTSATLPTPFADDSVELPYGTGPTIAGDDAIWVAVSGEDTYVPPRAIYRIDPATMQPTLVVEDIRADPTNPVAIVETQGSIWAVVNQDGVMFRFDSETGERLGGDIPLGDSPIEPHAGLGAVWSQDYDDGALTRIDPASGDVVTQIVIEQFKGQGPRHVATGASLLWAITPRTNTMVGIDPATNAVAKEVPLSDRLHCGVAVAAGRIWVQDCNDTALEVFDEATGARQGMFTPASRTTLPVHFDGTAVWIATYDVRDDPMSFTLGPVDPATLQPIGGQGVDLGVRGSQPIVAFDYLWYSFGNSVYRLSLDALATN